MPGTIKLFFREEQIAIRQYVTVPDRKKVVEKWRQIYGEKFKECSLQINPDLSVKKMASRLVQMI